MTSRSVYLATYKSTPNQRSHFAVFIPNAASEKADLGRQKFRDGECTGNVIQVVGEPLMSGYALQFERNYDAQGSKTLWELLLLGRVASVDLFEPKDQVVAVESTPRAKLEHQAAKVAPPPKGQDLRAPVDGVTRKDCQNWVVEFMRLLVDQGLIDPQAVEIAEAQVQSPERGAFGSKRPEQ